VATTSARVGVMRRRVMSLSLVSEISVSEAMDGGGGGARARLVCWE